MDAPRQAVLDEEGPHPSGLWRLFQTEMWERFSFYGMRAILKLYMVTVVFVSLGNEGANAQSSMVYAIYTSLVYLSPLLGGQVADRILGCRKSVMVGALVMAAGHFALAWESLFYAGLGLIVIGNGFFKPNISVQVGELYPKGSKRTDRAYQIFYAGINVGAFFSPLVCGTLGESDRFGYHWGFAAAGVGMLIGLAVFLMSQKHFGSAGLPPELRDSGITDWHPNRKDWRDVLLWSAGSLLLVFVGLQCAPIFNGFGLFDISPKAATSQIFGLFFYRLVLMFGVSLLFGEVIKRFGKKAQHEQVVAQPFTQGEKNRIKAIVIMTFFVIFFFMAFEQAGNTMTIFAKNRTVLSLLGFEFPASWFQAANPLFVVAITWAMGYMGSKASKMTSITKQGVGLLIIAIGCFMMYGADCASTVTAVDPEGSPTEWIRVSPLWLTGVYLIFTVGELFLSPIGLSLVKKLSPQRIVSYMMGIFFVGIYAGNYLAGTIELMLDDSEINMWIFLALATAAAGSILLFIRPWMNRLIGDESVTAQ